MTARIGLFLVLTRDRSKPLPLLGKMGRKALPCLCRAGKIVMPFVYFRRSVLEHTRDQAYVLRKFHRQEGRCRSPEIVKAHGLSKFCGDPRPSDVIQPARNQGRSSI